jgi:hypothetical protein
MNILFLGSVISIYVLLSVTDNLCKTVSAFEAISLPGAVQISLKIFLNTNQGYSTLESEL